MRKSFLVGLAATSALALPVSNIEAQVPKFMTFQGMLLNANNQPVADGQHSIQVSFYASATGGVPVLVDPISVNTVGGSFSAMIGQNATINKAIADFKQDYWLEVEYQGVKMPRMRMTTTAYAFSADYAYSAENATNAANATFATTAGSAAP